MATTLQLNGGAGGTLNLNDLVNYALLDGWRPRVAKRKRSILGGRRYENVVEDIPIRVFGATEAAALTALHNISALLEQAESWRYGAEVDSVLLQYKPHGSSLASPQSAAVLGAALDAGDLMNLSVTFNRDIQAYEINPVNLPLLRFGSWLQAVGAGATSSSITDYPTVMSVSLGSSASIFSPVKVTYNIESVGAIGSVPMLALVTNDNDKLLILQGESATGSGGNQGTTQADARASGGNYQRWTASASTWSPQWAIPSANQSLLNRCLVYASVRNNGATYWQVRPILNDTLTGESAGDWTTIPGDNTNPQIVRLGPVWTPRATAVNIALELYSEADATDTFDIDYLVLMRDDGNAHPIYLPTWTTQFNAPSTTRVIVDPRANTFMTPKVGTINTGTGEEMGTGWRGNAHVALTGDEIAALLLFTSSSADWTIEPNFTSMYITALRQVATLVPQ